MMEKPLNTQLKKRANPIPLIGLDLLGSDTDSNVLLESSIPLLKSLQNEINIFLWGEEKNRQLLESLPFPYQIAQEVISMHDEPIKALRQKKEASLLLGLRALKNKEIDALISLGNTGALVIGAKTTLKMIPSIKRPALLTLLPTKKSQVAILDVGANLSYTKDQLIQFALIGIAYQKSRGVSNPTVGLLNIGKEPFKGPPILQETQKDLFLLSAKQDLPFFYGNIEARDIFDGSIDVLITDGFSGNLLLKTSEGVANFFLQKHYKSHSEPTSHLEVNEYPGAVLCGTQGLIIKCHGNASAKAIYHSLIHAAELSKNHLLQKIEKEIQSFF